MKKAGQLPCTSSRTDNEGLIAMTWLLCGGAGLVLILVALGGVVQQHEERKRQRQRDRYYELGVERLEESERQRRALEDHERWARMRNMERRESAPTAAPAVESDPAIVSCPVCGSRAPHTGGELHCSQCGELLRAR